MLLSILNGTVGDSADQPPALPTPPSIDPQTVIDEVAAIRAAITAAHGVRLRFVIWAGTLAPDALGQIKGGPMSYTLNSADPEKLKGIVDDMQRRAHEPIAKLLPSTLVIGQSVASERIASIYQKFGIDSTPNFIDIDPARAFPFAVALANKDVKASLIKTWLDGSILSEADTADALKLAAYLRTQSDAGHAKLTLLLPASWSTAAQWTRRAFHGMNLIVDEKPNPRQYHKANDPAQDRVFLVVQRKGEPDADANAIKTLRAAGYPMAALAFNAGAPLSRYMGFMEATALALGLQAPEDSRDALAAEIDIDAAWKALPRETPKTLAASISSAAKSRAFSYGEIAFFGDLRYSENSALIRKTLDTAARLIFRTPFKMPGTVCEAPGEMLIGPAGAFTILIFSAAQSRFALAAFEPDRHIAQFLAAKAALEKKRRLVRAILIKDLSVESIAGLEEFFSQTAKNL